MAPQSTDPVYQIRRWHVEGDYYAPLGQEDIGKLLAEIDRLRMQLRQIDEAERVPYVESEMKVALMAALARQGLS